MWLVGMVTLIGFGVGWLIYKIVPDAIWVGLARLGAPFEWDAMRGILLFGSLTFVLLGLAWLGAADGKWLLLGVLVAPLLVVVGWLFLHHIRAFLTWRHDEEAAGGYLL